LKTVEIEQTGKKFFATIDGTRFIVGQSTEFTNSSGNVTRGLKSTGLETLAYDREEHRPQFGLWADLMDPTVKVEGGHLDALNTYDKAFFTFGFLQFAAHIAEGDFVKYFRKLLALPIAREYFPDLRLNDQNHIGRVSGSGIEELENKQSSRKLMTYLNPSSQEVDKTEVVNAAKFIHWVRTDPEHRRIQVETGAEVCKGILGGRAEQLKLNGRPDTHCLVIMDILHQGRGGPSIPKIKTALSSTDPFGQLLEIGKAGFQLRVEGLAARIGFLVNEGRLGRSTYEGATKDFVGSGILQHDSDDEVTGTIVKIGEPSEHQFWLYACGQRRPLVSMEEVNELRSAGLLDTKVTGLSREVLNAIPIMGGRS